jgi:hypothetical protein
MAAAFDWVNIQRRQNRLQGSLDGRVEASIGDSGTYDEEDAVLDILDSVYRDLDRGRNSQWRITTTYDRLPQRVDFAAPVNDHQSSRDSHRR